MQKVWKKIAVLVSVLCLTFTAAIFAACGDSAEKATYTVKVVLPDGDETPVAGVELTFCDETDETKTQKPVKTDADGKVTVTYKKANYRVKITDGMPDGYALFDAGSDIYCTKNWGTRLSCVITLDEAEKNYTVTVSKQGGTNVADVGVIFKPDSENAQSIERTTDENGEVKISLPANIDYLVTLDVNTLPDGFAMQPLDLNGISTANGSSINFTLSAGQNYSFEVTGPEGVNLEGIVIMCASSVNGSRTSWGTTDSNGKLSVVKPATTGYAFITAPAGYVYNEYYGEKDSPYILKKGTITFELIKRTDLALNDESAMDASEQAAFASNTGNSNFSSFMSEVGRSAYSFNAELNEGEKLVFSFTAGHTGDYCLFVDFTNCTIQSHDSLNLQYALSSLPSKTMFLPFVCTEGDVYFFSVTANTAQTIQLVVVTPAEKNDYSKEDVGEINLTIKDNLPATLYFRPTQQGEYKLTIQNGASGFYFEQISSATLAPIYGTGTETGESSFRATQSELFYTNGDPTTNRWIFRFTSTAANPAYPINITVKIERTGDAIEKTSVYEFAEVKEKLTQYGAQSGKLTKIGVTGTVPIVKGTDGYYHFGNTSGPVVVVKLKGPIPPFYAQDNDDFSTLDQSGNSFYTFYTGTDDTHNYFVNYARFLRGYTDYTDEPTIEVEEYYLKYVNADGMYPLTDELKVFLEFVAKANKNWFMLNGGSGAKEDSLWLFSAYYYDNASPANTALDADLPAWKKEN